MGLRFSARALEARGAITVRNLMIMVMAIMVVVVLSL